jgi:predicted ATP-grasp superfamily ATP-dependent carboligase
VSTNYENRELLLDTVRKYGFPVVVKPAFSKIQTGTGWLNASVRYAKNERDLRHILSDQIFHRFPFVIQERIEGPGVGIFLLMANGDVIARFAHRRIREKPPSGGVSVLCESVEMPPEAFQAAVKILRKLQWTGVAMVEFKLDIGQNIYKLLEVNARFWGSLQLAVSSGVDFPYLLYRHANKENIDVPDGFTIGLRSRWELGDLDHLLIRLFKDPKSVHLPLNYPSRTSVLKDFFCDFFRSSVKNEVLRISDSKPFIHELKSYLHFMFKFDRYKSDIHLERQ